MDGNYSALLPQRLNRATGLILLDVSTGTSLWRYVCRTWSQRDRIGGLDGGLNGGLDSVKWEMLRFIGGETRVNRPRYAREFAGLTMPKVRLGSVREIRRAHGEWGLRERCGSTQA